MKICIIVGLNNLGNYKNWYDEKRQGLKSERMDIPKKNKKYAKGSDLILALWEGLIFTNKVF